METLKQSYAKASVRKNQSLLPTNSSSLHISHESEPPQKEIL